MINLLTPGYVAIEVDENDEVNTSKPFGKMFVAGTIIKCGLGPFNQRHLRNDPVAFKEGDYVLFVRDLIRDVTTYITSHTTVIAIINRPTKPTQTTPIQEAFNEYLKSGLVELTEKEAAVEDSNEIEI